MQPSDEQHTSGDRTLELGPHASLTFEPWSGQQTHQLSVVLHISAPPGEADENWPLRFLGIENNVYAEVEGLGRTTTFVDATTSVVRPDGIVYRLVFEFTPEQVEAVRLGADLGFGVNDDRMRVGVRARSKSRQILLADLG